MKVFIANFGRENYAWPDCLSRGTVATMNVVAAQPMWEAGDRESYIDFQLRGATARGVKPTRAVASRWFNLMTIINETEGDLWIHKDKDQIWWTISSDRPSAFETHVEPVGRKNEVVICHKPCQPWSKVSRIGNRLEWSTLHPKAKDFLSTESTLQKLSEEYADYAIALINGDDLTFWHGLPKWQRKAKNSKTTTAVIFNPRQKSVAIMARTATSTTYYANGQEVVRTVKNKDLLIPDLEFEPYINSLLDEQDGLCAISGLPLQFHGSEDDKAMLCSLDRIDSSKHYEYGNLQIVCQFLNMWKGARDNTEFCRLIDILQQGSPVAET